MTIVWDEKKRQKNIQKHGLDFAELEIIFHKPMVTKIDDREDYGEVRWISLGDMAGTAIVLVYTEIPTGIRLISARRATKNEINIYFKKINS